MDNNTEKVAIKLSANIFYNILLDSMKNKRQIFEKCKEDTLTQTHMYYDLCVLTNITYKSLGDFEDLSSGEKLKQQYKNVSSKFRNGIYSSKKSQYFQLNHSNIVYSFDQQVKNDYLSAYKKIIEFSRRYFDNDDSARNKVMIQKLLYFIVNDISIEETQVFYINSDGTTRTKSEIKKIKEVEFEPFLLGVWHYLIASQRLQSDLNSMSSILNKLIFKSDIKLIICDETNAAQGSEAVLPKESKPNDSCLLKPKSAIKINKLTKNACNYNTEEILVINDMQDDYYPIEFDIEINIISVLENNEIALSRGIFFYLLVHNIKTVHPKRDKNAVERLFLDLLNLTVDNNCSIDFCQSLVRSQHDKFRYLKEISSADCLDDESKIKVFSDKICNNYNEALRCMIKISKKYFCSNAENESLVVALIEFIRNDKSIDDDHEFIVCSDGSALTKKQLCEIEEIEFEPFLLGIWYYVISQLTAKDSADNHTFDTVFKLSYTHNGKNCERYRSGNIIEQQSDMYVELIYLEE